MSTMMRSGNGRVRRSETQWQQLVSRFNESGQTGVQFCQDEGISRSTFDLWRRKLASKTGASAKRTAEFIEMEPVSERLGGWVFEVELPDGTIARIRG